MRIVQPSLALALVAACAPSPQVAPVPSVAMPTELDNANSARRMRIETLRAQFTSSTAFRQFVIAERLVRECVAAELDAQGRWEPDFTEPQWPPPIESIARDQIGSPREMKFTLRSKGRVYVVSREEFPEYGTFNDLRWRRRVTRPGESEGDVGPLLVSAILARCDRVLSTLR